MFYVKKRLEISASHQLHLSYLSKCENLHGHNWIIEIYCKGETLNQDGILVDFTEIKKLVHDVLDHKNLNEVLLFNPTAEKIAEWLSWRVPHCYKVTVQETEGNEAAYVVE